MMAVVATSAIALPYFQQADLITLFVFPMGWFPLTGNIGLLFPFIKFQALQAIVVVPAAIYIWLIGSAAITIIRPRLAMYTSSPSVKADLHQ